jgi:hydroxymethylbilane synthase
MTTSGDMLKDKCLADYGGKALFTKEIENALLDGTIDLAVHSLKDVETKRPHGLTLASILPREDPRDAFLGAQTTILEDLPLGALLGTSSPRRGAQALAIRPDLDVVPFRGNVGTRLEKLSKGVAQGTFLAVAGLNRLGISPPMQALNPAYMTPAAGQGALALECLASDTTLCTLLKKLEDPFARACVSVERAFLEILEGDCHTPLGVLVAGTCAHAQAWMFIGTSLAGPHLRFYEEGTLAFLEKQVLAKAHEGKKWLISQNL